MTCYYRPVPMLDRARPDNARAIAGGWCWFDRVERIRRGGVRELLGISEIPDQVVAAISAPRPPIAGLNFEAPRLMGILNVTPDSFSDGGRFNTPDAALKQAGVMVDAGADILDIGGESTRPGADMVTVEAEIARTIPVIKAIRAGGKTAISIDTRKAGVAQAALAAGADLINDVAAFTFDPALAELAASSQTPVCLMHAQGLPKTMQNAPDYSDVLLDVYDFLSMRIQAAEAAGIPRSRIIIDPGIGFGKTTAHCLALLNGISLFHALGCVILLGASRKNFIGDITGVVSADNRTFASVAVAMAAVSQGVQILRVHDIAATRQALTLHEAVTAMNRGQR